MKLQFNFDWRGPTSGPQEKWGFKPQRANPTERNMYLYQPTCKRSVNKFKTKLASKQRQGEEDLPCHLSCQLVSEGQLDCIKNQHPQA